jgi:hypothetical protein
MAVSEYQERASLARESLRTYLRPLSDYVAIYERVRGDRPVARRAA